MALSPPDYIRSSVICAYSIQHSFSEQTTHDTSWVPGTWVLKTQTVASKTGTALLSWSSRCRWVTDKKVMAGPMSPGKVRAQK